MKYRKKPVVVEAIQFTGTYENAKEIGEFTNSQCNAIFLSQNLSGEAIELIICTLEGDMKAEPGDYIIKGIHGEFYPCKPDIFAKTYEQLHTGIDWGNQPKNRTPI